MREKVQNLLTVFFEFYSVKHYRKEKNMEKISVEENRHVFAFRDDRMFCTVLKRHPDIAKELTELVTGRELGPVTYINDQETIGYVPDKKSGRLDVFFKGGKNTLVDLEMETAVSRTNLEELPKRGQHYASLLEAERAEAGESYLTLKEITVIFICLKDPLGKGFAVYVSEMTYDCNGPVPTNAGVKVIYLNSSAADSCKSKDLKALLEYIAGGEPGSELTKKIDAAVREINMEERWRNVAMTFEDRDRIMKAEGREEGLEEGLELGREEGTSLTMNKNIRQAFEYFVKTGKDNMQAIHETSAMYGVSIADIENILAGSTGRTVNAG